MRPLIRGGERWLKRPAQRRTEVAEATMRQLASTGRARTGVRAPAVARRAFGALLRMRQVMRQRRQLSQLPDYLLEDIGITPAQARREALRAFWDLPRTTFHRW